MLVTKIFKHINCTRKTSVKSDAQVHFACIFSLHIITVTVLKESLDANILIFS